MPVDDHRIRTVLKRYLKGGEHPDASLELIGISIEEPNSMCECFDDGFKAPRELIESNLVNFTDRAGRDLDTAQYDHFVHSYAQRDFCSPDRVLAEELDLPCEDGPPANIPLSREMRWVSTRPKMARKPTLELPV